MDWTKLIDELRHKGGLTQKQIAEACGVGQSAVSELASHAIKSPSFEFGSKLIALHRRECAESDFKVSEPGALE